MSRPNKFNAKPMEYDGVVYHSRAEARHAQRLDLLVRAGEIAGWERQVPLMIGEVGVDRPYRVDFVVTGLDGLRWAEEVKGVETPAFRRQKRQWRKRGPFELRIFKGRVVETIPAGTEITLTDVEPAPPIEVLNAKPKRARKVKG